jgi:hypothetical protein
LTVSNANCGCELLPYNNFTYQGFLKVHGFFSTFLASPNQFIHIQSLKRWKEKKTYLAVTKHMMDAFNIPPKSELPSSALKVNTALG